MRWKNYFQICLGYQPPQIQCSFRLKRWCHRLLKNAVFLTQTHTFCFVIFFCFSSCSIHPCIRLEFQCLFDSRFICYLFICLLNLIDVNLFVAPPTVIETPYTDHRCSKHARLWSLEFNELVLLSKNDSSIVSLSLAALYACLHMLGFVSSWLESSVFERPKIQNTWQSLRMHEIETSFISLISWSFIFHSNAISVSQCIVWLDNEYKRVSWIQYALCYCAQNILWKWKKKMWKEFGNAGTHFNSANR